MLRKPMISLFRMISLFGMTALASAASAEGQWQALPDKAPAPADNQSAGARRQPNH